MRGDDGERICGAIAYNAARARRPRHHWCLCFSPCASHRHDKGDGDAEQLAVVGHAQRVVASRGRNGATLLLLCRQHFERISRATLLGKNKG